MEVACLGRRYGVWILQSSTSIIQSETRDGVFLILFLHLIEDNINNTEKSRGAFK